MEESQWADSDLPTTSTIMFVHNEANKKSKLTAKQKRSVLLSTLLALTVGTMMIENVSAILPDFVS